MKNYTLKIFILVIMLNFFFGNFLIAGDKTIEISLPTIQCGRCIRTIDKALGKIDGIINTDIDVENKKMTLTYDDSKTDLAAIEKAITTAGYKANDKEADKEGYNKLHGCCKLPEDR